MCRTRRPAGLYSSVVAISMQPSCLCSNALKRVQQIAQNDGRFYVVAGVPLCLRSLRPFAVDPLYEHDALVRELFDDKVERRVVCVREKM